MKRGSEGGVVGRKDGVGRWGRGMGEGEMRKGGRLKRRGGRGEVVEERWGGEMRLERGDGKLGREMGGRQYGNFTLQTSIFTNHSLLFGLLSELI